MTPLNGVSCLLGGAKCRRHQVHDLAGYKVQEIDLLFSYHKNHTKSAEQLGQRQSFCATRGTTNNNQVLSTAAMSMGQDPEFVGLEPARIETSGGVQRQKSVAADDAKTKRDRCVCIAWIVTCAVSYTMCLRASWLSRPSAAVYCNTRLTYWVESEPLLLCTCFSSLIKIC